MPPDHAIFPKVNMEEFDTEMEKCVIKCIWQANKEQRKAEEEKAMKEVSEEIVAKSEEDYKVYDNDLNTLKVNKYRQLLSM